MNCHYHGDLSNATQLGRKAVLQHRSRFRVTLDSYSVPQPGSISVAVQWQFGWRCGVATKVYSQGGTMNLQSRIETLKERHAILETRIADEDQRPQPDGDALARLKVEKLRLKEEMERLRG
jgi:hypothetical protein